MQSGAEAPGRLITGEIIHHLLIVPWNDGMMEYWVLKTVCRRRINLCITNCVEKKDFIRIIPIVPWPRPILQDAQFNHQNSNITL